MSPFCLQLTLNFFLPREEQVPVWLFNLRIQLFVLFVSNHDKKKNVWKNIKKLETRWKSYGRTLRAILLRYFSSLQTYAYSVYLSLTVCCNSLSPPPHLGRVLLFLSAHFISIDPFLVSSKLFIYYSDLHQPHPIYLSPCLCLYECKYGWREKSHVVISFFKLCKTKHAHTSVA